MVCVGEKAAPSGPNSSRFSSAGSREGAGCTLAAGSLLQGWLDTLAEAEQDVSVSPPIAWWVLKDWVTERGDAVTFEDLYELREVPSAPRSEAVDPVDHDHVRSARPRCRPISCWSAGRSRRAAGEGRRRA